MIAYFVIITMNAKHCYDLKVDQDNAVDLQLQSHYVDNNNSKEIQTCRE